MRNDQDLGLQRRHVRGWLAGARRRATHLPMTEYLVWSFEHGRWRGPGGSGYTDDFEKAGRFTFEQALAICERANFVGLNEAMVPLGENTLAGERAKRCRGD